MFKLESYITPVLLNYVGKYVKNFKPEQSQVSLWDGDATFQNLDLELNVLNEQINIPFTFISGHIHELLIHVPWVKITSEPIVITINTIECILKLKDNSQVRDEKTLQQKTSQETLQEEAPSGYIKSIITKVVNNIKINCNNLILKFVEEDIVLSVNIRFLGFHNVDNLWKSAFTDLNTTNIILRKLITMKDLTLCLDRMDASGKIEIYQDPVIYRCSIVIRWLINYPRLNNNLNQRESVSRIDVHFNKIEFSVTEQQIPMILRLITLFMNSYETKISSNSNIGFAMSEKSDNSLSRINDDILAGPSSVLSKTEFNLDVNQLNWGSWAWNVLTSYVPDWGNDWSADKSSDNAIKTIDFGIFIDDAILTFKITEINRESINSHKNIKVKYRPFVTLQLSSVIGSFLMHGINFTGIQFSLGYIGIYPRGDCTCGFTEFNVLNTTPVNFLTAGTLKASNANYKKDSLFDLEAIENRGLTKDYIKLIKNCILSSQIDDNLLNNSTAFTFHYNHLIELPDEYDLIDDDIKSKLYDNLEFSNLIEHKLMQFYINDLVIKITSELLHRLNTIIPIIKNDFLTFFYENTRDLMTLENLRAVTIEEFDALNNYIPTKKINLIIKKLNIQFFLPDHFQSTRKRICLNKFGNNKNCNNNNNDKNKKKHLLNNHPKLILEAGNVHLTIVMPIYPFRLVSCASQQTEIPVEMLNNCYKKYNFRINGVTSCLNIDDTCQMRFINPFDCELNSSQLIYPQYWTTVDMINDSYDMKVENLTVTTTKKKLFIINIMLNSIFFADNSNDSLLISQIPIIYRDALNEINPVYLEVTVENIVYVCSIYSKNIFVKINIDSLRIFGLDDDNQAFIMSGPEENLNQSINNNQQLLNITVQCPRDFSEHHQDNYYLIVIVKISDFKIILDPLLFNWFSYNYDNANDDINLTNTNATFYLENKGIDEASSDNSTRKKFPSLHENVHSPSDNGGTEQKFNLNTANNKNQLPIKLNRSNDFNDKKYDVLQSKSKLTNFILHYYPHWRKLLFNVIINGCTICQPTLTINSVGVDGIEEAKNRAIKSDKTNSLKLFVMELCKLNIKSANWDNQLFTLINSVDLIVVTNLLNVKYFPWSLTLDKLHCYTVINKVIDNLLNIDYFNATIDATFKPNIVNTSVGIGDNNNANVNANNIKNNINNNILGFCIYIHTEPIEILMKIYQLELINYLLINNWSIVFDSDDCQLSKNSEFNQMNYFKYYGNDSNLKFIPQHPLSPSQLLFTETHTTETTSASLSRKDVEIDNDNSDGITSWIQWTITKIIIELSTENYYDIEATNSNNYFQSKVHQNNDDDNNIRYKIIIELEDIIMSIDWQLIYIKLKNKITAAKVTHFEKFSSEADNWKLGGFTGLIMSSKDEDLDNQNQVDFLNLTITKAKSNNVYNKWMRFNNKKFAKGYVFGSGDNSSDLMVNYITEIVIEMQSIDIILPFNLIYEFVKIYEYFCSKHLAQAENSMIVDNRQSLPLVYAEFKGLNLTIPVDLLPKNEIMSPKYDTLIIETDEIIIIPHAENPICRTILKMDIYELAAQSNILYTPGSILEDRQYQIKINNINISSTNWQVYGIKLNKKETQHLYTMNENPALEWNKLDSETTAESAEKLLITSLIKKLNICCIIAPPMIYKFNNTIVCGMAIEITFITDIEVYLSLEQINLLTTFYFQIQKLKNSVIFDTKNNDDNLSPNVKFSVNVSTTTAANTSTIKKQKIDSIQETFEELPKDSGIDVDTLSFDDGICLDSITINSSNSTVIPYEYVINSGKISIFIYEFSKNTAVNSNTTNMKLPLFFVTINQPNGYFFHNNLTFTVRINCYDVLIGINKQENDNFIIDMPSAENYIDLFLETKNGDPDPNTGIPPSFIIMKSERNSNNYQIIVDMGRPSKLYLSDPILNQINVINHKLMESIFNNNEAEYFERQISDAESSTEANILQMFSAQINGRAESAINVNLKTKQIVVVYKFNNETEIISNLSESTVQLLSKNKKVNVVLELFSLMITSNINFHSKIFLNPLSCKLISNMCWQPWQNFREYPLIQVQGYTDSINFELNPDQLKIINDILSMVRNYFEQSNKFSNNVDNVAEIDAQKLLSSEQHYQDDLKAGAFQFAEGTSEQFPLAYQVLFSNYPRISMTWKYPQPRVLTQLNLTNVLWEIIDTEEVDLNEINCVIEYWNDNLMSYQRYIEFKLSKIDSYVLSPNELPTRAVSCIWRSAIYSTNGETISALTARDLAECLRIDSYFNPLLVPFLDVTFNLNHIKFAIFNNYTHFDNNLPYPLDIYKLNNLIPPSQCFATFSFTNNLVIYNKWSNGAAMADLIGIGAIKILDYESMIMQKLLEPVKFHLQICQLNRIKILLNVKDLTLNFGAEMAHCATLSLNSWFVTLKNYENYRNESKNLYNRSTIFNGVIIANDCNVPIRFTQDKTTDDFILDSRECYFYSWLQKCNSKMRIAIKVYKNWVWSDLFNIYSKTNVINIKYNNYNIKVFFNIKPITSTQRIIFFTGQLVIRNELNDDFEVKLFRKGNSGNESCRNVTEFDETYFISKKSSLPSMLLSDTAQNNNTIMMKLRYINSNAEPKNNCGLWSGEIPLRPNLDCSQPWLVKLPTNNKRQFFSIWIRVIAENTHNSLRTLVILTPLYLIQSWLPSPIKIHIETPALSSTVISAVNKRGKKYQIYCPGTIEHSHELTIEFNDGTISQANISMSYNSVDRRNYFKRPQKEESIEAILDELDKCNNIYWKKSSSMWPIRNLAFDDCHTFVESPTDVYVKYQDGGLMSSTLLVELHPWCYILNCYGKPINLVLSSSNNRYKIPSNGIVSPPKIAEIFYIETEIFGVTFTSSPLEFIHSEVNRGFSMPQINGIIPLDDSVKIQIKSDTITAIFVIYSQIVDDIRIVKITSSHIISNLTDYYLKVAPIFVNADNNLIDNNNLILQKFNEFYFDLCPNDKVNTNSGISIDHWINLNLDTKRNNINKQNTSSMDLYVTLSLNTDDVDDMDKWSCPINVNKQFDRHCIAIQDGDSTLPVVVTVQKDAYVSYIIVNYDSNPQFTLKNNCPFSVIIGEPKNSLDTIELDAEPFSWVSKIKTGHCCNYTLKNFGNRMPDQNLIDKKMIPRLMLAIPGDQNSAVNKPISIKWKTIIEFPNLFPIKFDHFIYVDDYGDIKVMVKSFGHTIYINLELKSQVEVSIRDVRNRLINENKLCDKKVTLDKNLITIKSNRSILENISDSNSAENLTQDNIHSPVTEKYSCISLSSITNDQVILTFFFNEINIVITRDDEKGCRSEIGAIYFINTYVEVVSSNKCMNLKIFLADLQLDNKLFENGGFDFPVVLKSQNPLVMDNITFDYLSTVKLTTIELKKHSSVAIECSLDKINNDTTAIKMIYIRISPINIYIEDKFITQLLDYINTIVQPFSTINPGNFNHLEILKSLEAENLEISVPENIIINSRIISSPLRIQNLTIDPISMLLSVHTSARLYVALDHSPLHFGIFERHNLLTTHYKLGNEITMHYLSGAIFGAGWVVGSLEILGSPGSFAQALSTGLKDFISLPFRGLLQGPWGFIIGITHGSASLMKHITAGTVNSVTKLASSVARNLDRLTLDDEHLQRQEEARRLRPPETMTQGLYRGLTSFGISILAGVAGLAHHPLQNFWSPDPSPKGIVTGVGLGLVGVVTKPLSGAAELVALTGQGLLQRTGWNSMPLIRRRLSSAVNNTDNLSYRYLWKLMDYLNKNNDSVIYLVGAEMIIDINDLTKKIPVVMALTTKNLIIINSMHDNVDKIISFNEFSCVDESHIDPKFLRLFFVLSNNANKSKNHFYTGDIQEMDNQMRLRVEQYVLATGFNTYLNNDSTNDKSSSSSSFHADNNFITDNYDENSLLFLFDCFTKKCFLSIIKIMKRQMLGIDFTVL